MKLLCGFEADEFGGTLLEGHFVFPKGAQGNLLSPNILECWPGPIDLEMRVAVGRSVMVRLPVRLAAMQQPGTGNEVLAFETPNAKGLAATLEAYKGVRVSFAFYR
jgi:hypothetical protein